MIEEYVMSQPIIEALQGYAEAHPEEAQQLVANLEAKWDSLSDEQKEQVKAKALELRDQVASMTPEERAGIADQITSLI